MFKFKYIKPHRAGCAGAYQFNPGTNTVLMVPASGYKRDNAPLYPWLQLGCSDPACPAEVQISVYSLAAQIKPRYEQAKPARPELLTPEREAAIRAAAIAEYEAQRAAREGEAPAEPNMEPATEPHATTPAAANTPEPT